MYAEEDLLPLSGIQHFAYCPRQWGLIHVENQWVENLGTALGRLVHQRVDNPYFSESRGEVSIERTIPLASKQLGLYGMADLLEIKREQKGQIVTFTLVEYKKGKPKKDDCDEVQLCAQGICLEEMLGITLCGGYMYYDTIKHRQWVAFTDILRRRVSELACLMHKYYDEGQTPAAVKSKKCRGCSMESVCMPSLEKLKRKADKYLNNYLREVENEL